MGLLRLSFATGKKIRQRLAQQAASATGSKFALSASAAVDPKTDWRSRAPKDVRVLVVGATGYIGKFVVRVSLLVVLMHLLITP